MQYNVICLGFNKSYPLVLSDFLYVTRATELPIDGPDSRVFRTTPRPTQSEWQTDNWTFVYATMDSFQYPYLTLFSLHCNNGYT
jgi:hypothetical protein